MIEQLYKSSVIIIGVFLFVFIFGFNAVASSDIGNCDAVVNCVANNTIPGWVGIGGNSTTFNETGDLFHFAEGYDSFTNSC